MGRFLYMENYFRERLGHNGTMGLINLFTNITFPKQK